MALLAEDGAYWSRFVVFDGKFVPNQTRRNRALSEWPDWQNSHFRTALRTLGGGTVSAEDVMDRLLVSIGGWPHSSIIESMSSVTGSSGVGTSGRLNPDACAACVGRFDADDPLPWLQHRTGWDRVATAAGAARP